MSILIDSNTKVIVQGMTGTEGRFHTAQMIDYGTNVVAGVTPGRGGQTALDRPVFNTMREAVAETQANAAVIFVPARFAADAALESIEAGVPLVIIITEGIPTLQMMDVFWEAKRCGARLIGPNCPGIITPGQSKIGIMPGHIHRPGKIGVISRSGTLTYEFVNELTLGHYGESTCVGIGGDPIIGCSFIEILEMFNEDAATEAVVMIGEIGGTDEERAALWIKDNMKKPVIGFVAGRTAPPGKRMGHAGAIIAGGKGTAAEKMAAMQAAGMAVCERPDQVCELLAQAGIEAQ
jgi:succinyl-CoA synthetase alpha subunit